MLVMRRERLHRFLRTAAGPSAVVMFGLARELVLGRLRLLAHIYPVGPLNPCPPRPPCGRDGKYGLQARKAFCALASKVGRWPG
jgi:hypothetical protein